MRRTPSEEMVLYGGGEMGVLRLSGCWDSMFSHQGWYPEQGRVLSLAVLGTEQGVGSRAGAGSEPRVVWNRGCLQVHPESLVLPSGQLGR